MSNYAIASIPDLTLGIPWERGQREDDRLAAWQRYSMWHPDLPQVVMQNRVPHHPRILVHRTGTGNGWMGPVAYKALDARDIPRHQSAEPSARRFWHPSLPEVQSVGAAGVFAMTKRSVAPSWPFGTWRKVAAFAALLLCASLPALAAEPCKVNVATCTAQQCAYLPGVGPSKGAAIEAAHPADETALDSVPGIGDATLAKIRPFVTYQGETTCTSKQNAPKADSKDGAQ